MTRKLSLTVDGRNIAVHLHRGDLPDGVAFNGPVAVDSETLGLSLVRDRLCLVQISDGGPDAHLVQLNRQTYDAPNLKRVLTDPAHLKLFHFARFDIAMMRKWMGITGSPVWCTKIASRLARTYTDKHGLKDVAREVAGIDLSKAQQSSDWGAATLSAFALGFVLFLVTLALNFIALRVVKRFREAYE